MAEDLAAVGAGSADICRSCVRRRRGARRADLARPRNRTRSFAQGNEGAGRILAVHQAGRQGRTRSVAARRYAVGGKPGGALPGKDHPIRAGDIMILLPRREPFGSEIIRQLKAVNVAVAGADRIRITEQIGVQDLIALGRFALLPEDDLTLATVLRSPLAGIGEETLFALSYERKGTLWRSLQGNDDAALDGA